MFRGKTQLVGDINLVLTSQITFCRLIFLIREAAIYGYLQDHIHNLQRIRKYNVKRKKRLI
jgi:hypothetical protein